MNPRNPRREPTRSHGALIHRGPQATAQQARPVSAVPLPLHAPNAALLIDFDNVTMGIRSDLGHELRNLLGSDIIKGKVAVQRAYADWRRYPQYIVPLTEASIDLIFAPAYGSAKKNATDIRLAIDAMELVFTRPEIGTIILLSGDSDFSSLVIKLKEYGKYVIGVGIRESSSDLLVMNCDEYYSYNALAGLVKASEEEDAARKYDPWELVSEAISRMQRNGDVMRSDRLKQVMQDIDGTFDEKNTGHAKFSKFVTDAAARGLLTVTKLENGQLEVGPPGADGAKAAPAPAAQRPERSERAERPERGERAERGEDDERGRRGRRGGRGRGRGGRGAEVPQLELGAPAEEAAPPRGEGVGAAGERLTRAEAFDLARRAVETLATGDEVVRASAVRRRAQELLGRDSESLTERNFTRILQDAHDANMIDLRRRGDDYEVSRAVSAAPVAEQLAAAEVAATPVPAPSAPGPRLGLGPRGGGARGRGKAGEVPPDLLSIGVVETAPAKPAAAAAAVEAPAAAAAPAPGKRGGRKRTAKAAKAAGGAGDGAAPADEAAPTKPRRGRPRKAARAEPTET